MIPLDADRLRPALDLLRETGKEVCVPVRGSSMIPLIRPGDRAFLRPMDPARLRPGDVFAFRQGSATIVHRLIRRRRVGGVAWVCQKGDHQSAWEWIPEEQALGRVDRVQGARHTLHLQEGPWRWADPLWGRLWAAWIGAMEATGLSIRNGTGARNASLCARLARKATAAIRHAHVASLRGLLAGLGVRVPPPREGLRP